MEPETRPEDGTLEVQWTHRPLTYASPFEQALERALGPAVRAETGADTPLSTALWCALANVDWQHASGAEFSCTWRYAGDVVAALRQEGSYLDWYCCSEDYGTVAPEILVALAQEGWVPVDD